jgi:hypothetical protein
MKNYKTQGTTLPSCLTKANSLAKISTVKAFSKIQVNISLNKSKLGINQRRNQWLLVGKKI